jgi:hypothetical protein
LIVRTPNPALRITIPSLPIHPTVSTLEVTSAALAEQGMTPLPVNLMSLRFFELVPSPSCSGSFVQKSSDPPSFFNFLPPLQFPSVFCQFLEV